MRKLLPTRGSRRALLAVAALTLVVGLVPLRIVTSDVSFKAGPKLDVAVVLGAATRGKRPSLVFAARLDFARDLLQQERARFVLVTGGTRDEAELSEGEVGRQYLIARGVDPRQVLAETRSTTTHENLCNALEIGGVQRLHAYAIVSDPLHLPRALRFASDIGMTAVPAATPYTRYQGLGSRLGFLARESYFYVQRLLLGARRC
jgi:uncharacterized SAM-binding protein YcdF (DUF218 family)